MTTKKMLVKMAVGEGKRWKHQTKNATLKKMLASDAWNSKRKLTFEDTKSWTRPSTNETSGSSCSPVKAVDVSSVAIQTIVLRIVWRGDDGSSSVWCWTGRIDRRKGSKRRHFYSNHVYNVHTRSKWLYVVKYFLFRSIFCILFFRLLFDCSLQQCSKQF